MGAEIVETEAALWWTGPLAIDADGAPDAYHPDGKSGRDYLANAKNKKGDWVGIVVDGAGQPVVQGAGDPCPGFYVSPTSLQDRTRASTDPRRYVDSVTVPYVAVARDLVGRVALGDVALVYCRQTGRMSAAVVADVGPKGEYGEGSIALAHALGLPSSPRNGGASAGVTVVVYKRTRRGWPRSAQDVAQQAQDLLNAAGGDFEQYL